MRAYIRFRWIAAVVLVPFVLLGLVVLAVKAYGLVRHDPAYFSEPYITRYGTPEAVVRALEIALQTDDQALLAELQGLRWPARFKTSPGMAFIMLLERNDRYTTYLYFDVQTYKRYSHYLEQVKGRWVVSPPDLYYTMHSGQWQQSFWRLATIWWVVGAVVILAVGFARASERFRAWLYTE
jgi:hypothetical protein